MKRILPFISIALLIVSCTKEVKNVKVTEQVFGTSYAVTYFSETNLVFETQFDSLFYVINKSLSTYQLNSDISKLNRNERVLVDNHFTNVLDA